MVIYIKKYLLFGITMLILLFLNQKTTISYFIPINDNIKNTFTEKESISIKHTITNIEKSSLLLNVEIKNNLDRTLYNLSINEILNNYIENSIYIPNDLNNIYKKNNIIKIHLESIEKNSTKNIKYTLFFNKKLYHLKNIKLIDETNIEYIDRNNTITTSKYDAVPILKKVQYTKNKYDKNTSTLLSLIILLINCLFLLKVLNTKKLLLKI